MALFRYRLQPLLDQRLRAQKTAEEALVGRQRELQAARRREQELRDEQRRLTDLRARLRRELLATSGDSPLTVAEIGQRKDFLEGLAEDLERARDAVFSQQIAVEECGRKVDAAAREVAECQRRAEVLEKHRNKLEKRFQDEIEAKEALEQDELGNVMYLMRRRRT